LAFTRIAFHHAGRAAPALETRARGGSNHFAWPVELIVDLAAFDLDLAFLRLEEIKVDLTVQIRRKRLTEGGQECILLGLVEADVLRRLADWTLVTRAAEAVDAFLDTSGDWWRARLL